VADEVLEVAQGHPQLHGKFALGWPAPQLGGEFDVRPLEFAGPAAQGAGQDVDPADGVEDRAAYAANGEAGEGGAAAGVV